MNTATYTTAPANSLRQQLANLRRALGDFAKALYAAQGREFAVADPVVPVALSARMRRQGRAELLSLANQHQHYSPSLSTELRSIASRG